MGGASGAFSAGPERRIELIKGAAFKYTLVGATLLAITSLVVLVGLVSWDAFGLAAATPAWFLVYGLTLGVPTLAYVAYVRRSPPATAVSLRLAAAALGGPTLAALAYTVPQALDPFDVFVYVALGAGPPALIAGYGRAKPTAIWTGTAVPIAVVVGVGTAAAAFGPLRRIAGSLAEWVVYLLVVALPVAAAVRFLYGGRTGVRVAAGVATVATLAGALGGRVGYDPAVAVVVIATALVPIGLVVADAAANRRAGWIGLAWPPLVAGGVGIGVVATRALDLAGPDSWVTVTLLTESFSTLSPRAAGIYPQLIGSVILVGLMALLTFPIGIGAAVYLEEYAPGVGWAGRVTRFLQVNIANLAGVPSVVYGLLGLGIFVNMLGQPRGLLIAGSATLGLLILPIVIVSAQEAIRAVPDSRRQAAYGMGASRWQTVRTTVLPESLPGILTGTILALGRAIGETAPILIIGVATSKFTPPAGVFEKATALPLQIFAARSLPQPDYRFGVLAAAVVVLLVLMLSMNAVAIVLRNKYQRRGA